MACQNQEDACNCPQRSKGVIACLTGFFRSAAHECYNVIDIGLNLFCALKDIATAIRELKNPNASTISGCLNYEVSGYGELEDGQTANVELFISPFEHDVVGIGASYIPPALTNTGQIYDAGDKVIVRIFDFTASAQIGEDLRLSQISTQSNQTNLGQVIGSIGLGHKVGVVIEFDADPGDEMQAFPFQIFIFVKPTALNT